MTTQPTVHPATPAATSIHHGMPTEIGCRAGTRTAHTAARLRRRALTAAVLPAGAASASPQAPEVDTHFTNPGGNPQPPEPPDPPAWGPQDVANPTENPEPPLPPDPPDVPDWGPDDLANPTEKPRAAAAARGPGPR
jgi:hypothetical protein